MKKSILITLGSVALAVSAYAAYKCKFCNGTGWNKFGETCVYCKGTGVQP